MEFEWDNAKERTNRKKHGIGFRAATRVFLDPFAIELDDSAIANEPRFNVIGMVDGRMIFVVYAITVTDASGALVLEETQTRINR